MTPATNIEPLRKALSELLGQQIKFEEVHNEIILLDMGLNPINKTLSEMIVKLSKTN